MAQADERVGDADRDRAANLVSDSCAKGYLDVSELDDRLERVFAARTHAELATITADLPQGQPEQRPARRRSPRRPGPAHQLPAYAAMSVLLVAIWLTVGVTAQTWYPWPVWPIAGWEACLLRSGALSDRRRGGARGAVVARPY